MKIKDEYITKKPTQRLYETKVPIIGLTGGIGSGKSTVTAILKRLGYFVIDADDLVHEIYDLGDTHDYIKSVCPSAIDTNNNISFQRLREHAFNEPDLLENLEKFIYEKIPTYFNEKLKETQSEYVIYDVPLLFEKNLDDKVDISITVYVDRETQRSRAMTRDECPGDIIDKIIDKQIPLSSKRDQSDFVIDNSSSLDQLEKSITKVFSQIFI